MCQGPAPASTRGSTGFPPLWIRHLISIHRELPAGLGTLLALGFSGNAPHSPELVLAAVVLVIDGLECLVRRPREPDNVDEECRSESEKDETKHGQETSKAHVASSHPHLLMSHFDHLCGPIFEARHDEIVAASQYQPEPHRQRYRGGKQTHAQDLLGASNNFQHSRHLRFSSSSSIHTRVALARFTMSIITSAMIADGMLKECAQGLRGSRVVVLQPHVQLPL